MATEIYSSANIDCDVDPYGCASDCQVFVQYNLKLSLLVGVFVSCLFFLVFDCIEWVDRLSK